MKKVTQSSLLILFAFLAIYIIWGTTYLAILFGLEGFPPFLLSGIRFTVAGLILISWCRFKKEKLPVARDLKIAIISGIVMLVGGSGLVTVAEQYVTSGQAAIITATEPFIFLLFDRKRWHFYFSKKNIITGLLVGFSGIIMFVLYAKNSSRLEESFILKCTGYGILFVSCVLWVCGSLYSKAKTDKTVSNTATTSVQLLAAGIFSSLVSIVTGEMTTFTFTNVGIKAWGGLAYLVTMGSVVAYLAFNWLLTMRPPAQVSTHTYINPVIALFVGWWIAHEPIVPVQLAAVIIILAGVYLTNKKASYA